MVFEIFLWTLLGLFLVYFCLFKQAVQFYIKLMRKIVANPVSGAGIWSHDLLTMSLFP